MSKWYVETMDRDGQLYVWYRHGSQEEVEERMWLDFPDHVVLDFVAIDEQQPAYKELNFDVD